MWENPTHIPCQENREEGQKVASSYNMEGRIGGGRKKRFLHSSYDPAHEALVLCTEPYLPKFI